MTLLNIDQLHSIQLYFEEMDISKEEKKKREELCEDLFYVYYYIFALLYTDFTLNGVIDVEQYANDLEKRFTDVVRESGYASVMDDEEISEYANTISKNLVESTMRNLPTDETDNSEEKDPIEFPKPSGSDSLINNSNTYWGSSERAIRVAEDMTNVIGNYSQLQRMIEAGYTHKTWVSILDNKTRPSHWLAWGQTKPIKEPFDVGGVKMMCPCDHTAPAREVANCRCSLHFSK